VREFTREDNRTLQVAEGFRQFLLQHRPPTSPRADWSEAQYTAAAKKKRARASRLIESFRHWCGSLEGVALLDVCCGDGSNCLALDEQPVKMVVGIDLELPLFASTPRGEQVRMLASRIGQASVSPPQGHRHFAQMDATALGFADGTFDVLMSRSATEHIRPIDRALGEMVRVVCDGGLIYLGIDPYFWLRGCHKRGVVDIPWAHARLSLAEFRRFVVAHEGAQVALERCRRLETLNRFTVAEWRRRIEQMGCEILEWRQLWSSLGEEVMARHPDVLDTLLPGVTEQDLLCERIEVWLRKRSGHV